MKLLLTANDKNKANPFNNNNNNRKNVDYPSIEGIYKTAGVERATKKIEAVFLQHPELKQELKELLLRKPKKESCCIQ